jgi:hypothetical protein
MSIYFVLSEQDEDWICMLALDCQRLRFKSIIWLVETISWLFFIITSLDYLPLIRAANELGSSELGLPQVQLIKIRAKLSRGHEMLQRERPNLSSAHYYLS